MNLDYDSLERLSRSHPAWRLLRSDHAQYSEAKFLQVKTIIERFRGRDGLAEMDRR